MLTRIQQERQDIVSEDVNFGRDYVIVRSYRMGAEVGDLKTRVAEPVISATNRW